MTTNITILVQRLKVAAKNGCCHTLFPDDCLALVEALEKAQQRIASQREYYEGVIADGGKRIAELESRTVKLPPTFWYEHDDLSRDVPVLDKRLVKKMLREAGIKVEAE